MGEYWGLNTIAKRMRMSIPTLYRMHKEFGFLMYKRWPAGSRAPFVRWRWFTTDELIREWEIARCRVDRDRGEKDARSE